MPNEIRASCRLLCLRFVLEGTSLEQLKISFIFMKFSFLLWLHTGCSVVHDFYIGILEYGAAKQGPYKSSSSGANDKVLGRAMPFFAIFPITFAGQRGEQTKY